MTAADRDTSPHGDGISEALRGTRKRVQSSHGFAARGLDSYFTPVEAVSSLMRIEHRFLPKWLWEPAAGDGAIVRPLREAGYRVVASDIVDYGLEDCQAGVDYLTAKRPARVEGIVTNPPYRLAVPFARKALDEVPYLALLLRTNFLESAARLAFFREHEPARIWIAARRLPMMHRRGWNGQRAPSNICFAWFIWDKSATQKRILDWFDWKESIEPSQESLKKSGQGELPLFHLRE